MVTEQARSAAALGKALARCLEQTPPQQALLVNAWRSLSNALGVGFTRGISLILLGFKHHAPGRCSECFGINQQGR